MDKSEDEFSEITVVDAEEVKALSQQGWTLVKVVSSQSKESLCKQFPFQQNGGYPSSHSYSEEAVIQKAKFVMGKTDKKTNLELQGRLRDLEASLSVERTEHTKAKGTITELGNAVSGKGVEIRKLSDEIGALKERYANLSGNYEKLSGEYERLKKATLETIVKLPGGNEVSVDAAGKMVRTGETLGQP